MTDPKQFTESDTQKRVKNPTLAVQTIVCLVVLATVFSLAKSGSPLYQSVKNGYYAVMSRNMCEESILDSAQKLFDMSAVSRTVSTQNTKAADNAETETAASIDSDAEIVTVTSSGGEDIRVLDALSDSTFDAVHISTEAVMPVSGNVTSDFGYRIHPITKNKSFHTGIDIAAPTGTEISACYDGTVTETGFTSGKGNYILMDHGDNLQTLYCHLSKISVSEGTVIRAGETIGLVGSTGMSTGPHLHFELRVDGIRCNPAYILKGLTYEV